MAINIKFKILGCGDYPTFELVVRRWGWIDKEYKWSCPPGYILASSGVGHSGIFWTNPDFFDLTLVMEQGYSESIHICGLIREIPREFNIGSTGNMWINYGGVQAKKILEGSGNALSKFKQIFDLNGGGFSLSGQWEIIDVY